MNQFNIPSTPTYTNNRVALRKCMVFSWTMLSTEGWLPIEQLDHDDLLLVRDLMDHDTIFPPEAHEFVRKHLEKTRPDSAG